MSVASVFKKIAEYLKNSFFSLFSGQEAKILNDIKRLAIPALEAAARLDLNGDGRISAATEIVSTAQSLGLEWGKVWINKTKEEGVEALAKHYTDGDLMRWYASTKLIKAVILKYGKEVIPQNNRILNAILEIALTEKLVK